MQNQLFLAPIKPRDWHPVEFNWTKKSGISSRFYFLRKVKPFFWVYTFLPWVNFFCRRFNVSNRMENKGFWCAIKNKFLTWMNRFWHLLKTIELLIYVPRQYLPKLVSALCKARWGNEEKISLCSVQGTSSDKNMKKQIQKSKGQGINLG